MQQKEGKMKKANFHQQMRCETPVCFSKYTTVVSKTCVKNKTEGHLRIRLRDSKTAEMPKTFLGFQFFFNDEEK